MANEWYVALCPEAHRIFPAKSYHPGGRHADYRPTHRKYSVRVLPVGMSGKLSPRGSQDGASGSFESIQNRPSPRRSELEPESVCSQAGRRKQLRAFVASCWQSGGCECQGYYRGQGLSECHHGAVKACLEPGESWLMGEVGTDGTRPETGRFERKSGLSCRCDRIAPVPQHIYTVLAGNRGESEHLSFCSCGWFCPVDTD